ncbi:branched-chain amino acid ABC transporter permease [Herbaspirillum seropedicae]|uniref:ABC-type amino acid transport system, permease component protein n=1 Tax=Herbaspirillum seropedicae (strain SmR1) TaxID=757424 RepID=D8IZ49_HERSS|nr:branched-chain amino acid ABC transporter permease [Herbaspirillum seropedicae]ADJ66253.1 ABC-type amino acid transport system, permease component protein [Herbaspirillum seropedicae SmR1]AKN68005.1 ABC transporter permease [Herbaspirillum seropedicae]AON57190.1 amino acid ABC transporter permease [Herbaspirillum seropedicae]MDR6398300.1 branched-chain amino acid transport system permease protein [Herbaspirillum seropedicae]NQE30091.1 ABC transporter permease [Herbaspirillum seropedicae]
MNKKIGIAVLLILLLAAPFGIYPVFLMKMLCFALFACAFNLLIGYTGLLSFGHAAFLGWAGYMCGQALKVWGLPTELGLIIGTLTGALIGLVMGLLAIRRQGIYFTMITLALAQMLFFVALQAPFTGGEDGLQGVPRGKLLGFLNLESDMTLYYVVLAIAVAGFALIVRTIHSPFGQVLKAIKENEPRAISLGYDVARYKLLAFVLSAGLSGLAGATKTLVLGFETLTDVHWSMSGLVVLMTLVGGLGTILGPIVGAVIIIMLENKLGDIGAWLASVTHIDWFNTLGDSVTIVTGFIFIVCVLAFRKGIVGEILALTRKGQASGSH